MRLISRTTLAAFVTVAGSIAFAPGSASAHTELDFTVPAEGAAVGQPVAEITIGFTEPVTLVGNGFVVLDPTNHEIEPFAVTDDDMVFKLIMDPPLTGGPVGVSYTVAADDGHVLEGSFSFTAAAPTPTTLVVVTSAPVATQPLTLPSTLPSSTPGSTSASTQPVVVATAPTAIGATAGDDSGGGSDAAVVVVAVLVAAGAAAFFVIRARRSA
jgi:copper transport protein